MKKYLLTVALIYSVTGFLFAQLTTKNDVFKVSPLTDVIESNNGVVSGRIIGVDVYWNEERTLCYNHYTVEVISSSNKALPGKIVLVTEASKRNDVQVEAGSGNFQVGNEVFAYLAKIPRNWECGYTPKHAYSARIARPM